MISDAQLEFSSAQAVTAAAASTNVIDFEAVRDIGSGNPLYIYTIVTTTMTDTSSNSQVVVSLQGSATAGGTYAPLVVVSGTDAAATTLLATGGPSQGGQILYVIPAVTAAGTQTAAGTIFVATVNPQAQIFRFLRVFYTPINGDLSAGAFTTRMSISSPIWKGFADGFTIS